MTDELDYVQNKLKSKVAPLNSTVMGSSPQKYYTHSTYTNYLAHLQFTEAQQATSLIIITRKCRTLSLSKLIQEHCVTNE